MDVFDADPKSVYELFLMRGAAGYYIPAYQREYSWDARNHVHRFLEDICTGVNTFVEHDDSITFIGSIISIRDTENKTIKPYVQGHLPSEVMTVIDGQQRVTTMSLLGSVLHNTLSTKLTKLARDHQDIAGWFLNKSGQALNNLKHTFELDVYGTDQKYRFYPKIIRSYADQWAKEEQLAEYTSPISRYHFGYINFIHEYEESRPSKDFPYDINDVPADIKTKHKRVLDNVRFLRKSIKAMVAFQHEDFQLPSVQDRILGNPALEKRFFEEGVPEEIVQKSVDNELISEALALLMLSNFFLNRVAVTAVVAKNESYAFDMFEALNTTGEPLTAFETFKPKVIDSEDIAEYEGSVSRVHIEIIDSVLDRYTKAEDKQKATTRLLIPFRLLYEGEKLSKHLSAQRRFLSKAYDSCETIEEKRSFTQSMCELTEFMDKMWPEQSSSSPEFEDYNLDDKDLILLCLTLLREANHNITIPLIARYYSHAKLNDFNESSLTEFGSAVKAVVAFFILWRSSRSSTDGIDEYYREIMKSGYGYESSDGETVVVCGAFSLTGTPEVPPAATDLKSAFSAILQNKRGDRGKLSIIEKGDWVRRAVVQPLYNINKPMTRFMILLSSHDTVATTLGDGLVEVSVPNVNPMLNLRSWFEQSTIEHIWPRSGGDGWSNDLEELQSEHVLGNLTLLPRSENSSAGARDWSQKKLIYKVLSSETEDVRNRLLVEAQDSGVQISSSTEDILRNANHLPQIKSISLVGADFNKRIVDNRAECLSSLIWDRLVNWLGDWE